MIARSAPEPPFLTALADFHCPCRRRPGQVAVRPTQAADPVRRNALPMGVEDEYRAPGPDLDRDRLTRHRQRRLNGTDGTQNPDLLPRQQPSSRCSSQRVTGLNLRSSSTCSWSSLSHRLKRYGRNPDDGPGNVSVILTPVLKGIRLILAVAQVLDMCRTTVNVWSDSCGAVVMARMDRD